MSDAHATHRSLSRRDFLKAAAGAGMAAVIVSTGWPEGYAFAAGAPGSLGTGTVPEQVHLTWGSDPSSQLTVSWCSPQAQVDPQLVLIPSDGGTTVIYSGSTSTVMTKSYTDGISGETVYAYHVPLTGLTPPGATYSYAISDAGASSPISFSSEFTLAQSGRFPFTFTSYGDLATPGVGATYTLADGTMIASTTYAESQWNAYTAVAEVENQAPLFHLLNGDLCYADKATGPSGASGVQNSAEVWRDFGLNVQRSAANRPWMPCIGNHEAELENGPYGYASFNTRYVVPSNGTNGFAGNFYSFEIGSVLFIALDANDVCYQGSGAYNTYGSAYVAANGSQVTTTTAQYNRQYTGSFGPANPDGTLPPGSNAQTVWLENLLATARAGGTVDWIVVQMHQCAMSSSTDNGCDAGIRQTWLPLFAQYQVDLVLNGHDHDYERTYPINGFTAPSGTGTWTGGTVYTNGQGATTTQPANTSSKGTLQTFCPQPVGNYTPSSTTFDTTQGTVFLTIGGGGTNAPDNTYGSNVAVVHTFTQVRVSAKPKADSTEVPVWSAKTDPTKNYSYGIAVFSVDPGQPGGNTSITVSYYDALQQTNSGSNSPTPAYNDTPFDSFTLTRPRSDVNSALPEFKDPALVLAGVAVAAGGALYLRERTRGGTPPGEQAKVHPTV